LYREFCTEFEGTGNLMDEAKARFRAVPAGREEFTLHRVEFLLTDTPGDSAPDANVVGYLFGLGTSEDQRS